MDADIGNDWGASDFQAMSLRALASNDMGPLPETASYRHAGDQRCIERSERPCSIDAPLAWQADCYGKHEILPYGLEIPHRASTGSHWTRIDQDTCSGGSTWSPKTSDSRSEAEGYLSHSGSQNCEVLGVHSDYNHSRDAWCLPGGSPFHGSGCKTLNPHELQQFHDLEPCVEEVNQRLGPQEVILDRPYSPESIEQFPSVDRHDRFGPEDEALGSSIKDGSTSPSIQDDNDSAMGDSPDVDDDDDYKPRTVRRGHGRRLSQKCMTTKSPTSGPKRSQRIKSTTSQYLKPTKIAKKASKSSITSSPPVNKNGDILSCHYCRINVNSESALKKHVLASHTRPFKCTFHDYGCSSTVGSKNEWKRHINVQHMHLETWRCDIGVCAVPMNKAKEHHQSSTVLGEVKSQENPYHDFDRKDLFTQHLKRMHAPAPSASLAEKNKFEGDIKHIQKRCHKRLREPPANSICPYCPNHPVFETWDDRVEHVGKHLEKSDFDKNNEIEDEALRDWLQQEGCLVWKGPHLKWRLNDTGKKRKSRGDDAVKEEGDEDAEGDDE
ncbi:hypothetical protein ACLMJK_002598 [Lecanora helva]